MKICVILFYLLLVSAQDQNESSGTEDDDERKLNPLWSYCLEFTWVGPGYDNFTRFEYKTCGDYIDATRGNNVPCRPPIVITYDGTPPNIDYLFENYKPNVLCKRTDAHVCATYTYRFDGKVVNATYMCTQVRQVGAGAITSGTYTDNVRGYEVETSVCKSSPGLYKPCNWNLVDYN